MNLKTSSIFNLGALFKPQWLTKAPLLKRNTPSATPTLVRMITNIIIIATLYWAQVATNLFTSNHEGRPANPRKREQVDLIQRINTRLTTWATRAEQYLSSPAKTKPQPKRKRGKRHRTRHYISTMAAMVTVLQVQAQATQFQTRKEFVVNSDSTTISIDN